MSEAFVGQIQPFGFNFAPRGWAQCNGQLIAINSNTALFSLLGTFYGGNGQTTFGLPDLRGRVPMHFGSGPGLTPYPIGAKGGLEGVTLTQNQMPTHTHVANASGFTVTFPASTSDATTDTPSTSVKLSKTAGVNRGDPGSKIYSTGTADTNLGEYPASGTITNSNTGGSLAHENRQPFLAINYCICQVGLYPSRN